jgi:hypothetical protein
MLVDDGLVDKDKIGGSNYFWSFPGKKDRHMQLKHEALVKSNEELKQRVVEAEAKLADAKRGREDDNDGGKGGLTGERARKLVKLAELTAQKKAATAELESLKANDPQALADLEKEMKLVKEAAERWTDNLFSCKCYLVKKRGMNSKEACRMIGITADFDCKLCTVVMYCTMYSMFTMVMVMQLLDVGFWLLCHVIYETHSLTELVVVVVIVILSLLSVYMNASSYGFYYTRPRRQVFQVN